MVTLSLRAYRISAVLGRVKHVRNWGARSGFTAIYKQVQWLAFGLALPRADVNSSRIPWRFLAAICRARGEVPVDQSGISKAILAENPYRKALLANPS